MVPMPSVVKISFRMECGLRPSMMWARGTPPSMALTQASILGRMPLSKSGSISRRFSTPIRPIRESLSGQSAYRPSTSVNTTSLLAPRAAASAAAAESAFTFNTSVASSSFGATEDTTGMRPALIRSSTADASTLTTSPTKPISVGEPLMIGLRCMAEKSAPSSPERPTANGPWALINPTSSRETLPVKTIRTTSMASGVVTLRPPLNSDLMPKALSM